MQRMIFGGDIMLLKITAVGSLEFSKFAFYVTSPLSVYHHAILLHNAKLQCNRTYGNL